MNLIPMLAFRFAENVQIIWSGLLVIFIHWESFERKYFVITMASLTEFIDIIILEILCIAPLLGIVNTRFLKPRFFINEAIYMRFG